MGKHNSDKFYCDMCDRENKCCEHRAFHLQQYRRHYYLMSKSKECNQIQVHQKKVKLYFD